MYCFRKCGLSGAKAGTQAAGLAREASSAGRPRPGDQHPTAITSELILIIRMTIFEAIREKTELPLVLSEGLWETQH